MLDHISQLGQRFDKQKYKGGLHDFSETSDWRPECDRQWKQRLHFGCDVHRCAEWYIVELMIIHAHSPSDIRDLVSECLGCFVSQKEPICVRVWGSSVSKDCITWENEVCCRWNCEFCDKNNESCPGGFRHAWSQCLLFFRPGECFCKDVLSQSWPIPCTAVLKDKYTKDITTLSLRASVFCFGIREYLLRFETPLAFPQGVLGEHEITVYDSKGHVWISDFNVGYYIFLTGRGWTNWAVPELPCDAQSILIGHGLMEDLRVVHGFVVDDVHMKDMPFVEPRGRFLELCQFTHAIGHLMARRIQVAWRRCIANPDFFLCRRRLQNEFLGMHSSCSASVCAW
jgi:hypothetical protein